MRVLQRRGADIRVSTSVRSIEAGRVHLEDQTIDAGTIVLAAGTVPSAIASGIPVVHDERVGSPSTQRCGVAATRTYGRWVTALRSRDRMAAPIRRWPNAQSARHDSSRAT
jgi:hypothetical protein